MADDWRIHIDVEEEHGRGLLERLADELSGEARELARELEARRLAVSRSGDDVYVYASSQAEAEAALRVIEAELREHDIEARTSSIERWLADADRWSDEPPAESWEQEEVERGFAPWEVRVDCESQHEANRLADELEAEGYRPERRFQFLIVGTETREDADALAQRLHGSVEPGGELVWETAPGNPFAVFGGMGL